MYAVGGYYYPDKDILGLKDEFKEYLDLGFTTSKLKVGGATVRGDLNQIEVELEVVR